MSDTVFPLFYHALYEENCRENRSGLLYRFGEPNDVLHYFQVVWPKLTQTGVTMTFQIVRVHSEILTQQPNITVWSSFGSVRSIFKPIKKRVTDFRRSPVRIKEGTYSHTSGCGPSVTSLDNFAERY